MYTVKFNCSFESVLLRLINGEDIDDQTQHIDDYFINIRDVNWKDFFTNNLIENKRFNNFWQPIIDFISERELPLN